MLYNVSDKKRNRGEYNKNWGDFMRKFKIPSIPATEPKSIRFPVDVIAEVEDVIRGKDCTFSAFVVEAVRVALESLREEDEQDET